MYSKDSLLRLKEKVDLVDLIGSLMTLKRTGSTYKGLCPFHQENTPSFQVQRGAQHYHCFGCGAHGDAISFVMQQQSMSFSEAIDYLSQRYHIPMEEVKKDPYSSQKSRLKEVLKLAWGFYQHCLWKTKEGCEALEYLYERGFTKSFIEDFALGYAPSKTATLKRYLNEMKYKDEELKEAGLLSIKEGGRKREFFSERIIFPILNTNSEVIGFSARKYKESTFGGKYINSPETLLFKKSYTLFGLPYCKQRIRKDKHAIIVEGQVDALRLINAGLNCTVAALGTAFGEHHVQALLRMGVKKVYLLFDGDGAGKEAARKVGHLFQKEGCEAFVAKVPEGEDPDTLLLRENGVEEIKQLLNESQTYLPFLLEATSTKYKLSSPAEKNEWIAQLVQQIKEWNEPVMVYETLKQLASLTQVPEEVILKGVRSQRRGYAKQASLRNSPAVSSAVCELDSDFLRWLLHMSESNPAYWNYALNQVKVEHLKDLECRRLYEIIIQSKDKGEEVSFMSLSISLEEESLQGLVQRLSQKKIIFEKALDLFPETIFKIQSRNWLEKGEALRLKIQSGSLSDNEAMNLAKAYSDHKKEPPVRAPFQLEETSMPV